MTADAVSWLKELYLRQISLCACECMHASEEKSDAIVHARHMLALKQNGPALGERRGQRQAWRGEGGLA